NHEQLKQHITSLFSDTPDKFSKHSWHGIIEGQSFCLTLQQEEFDKNTTSHHLSNQQLNDLVTMFKGFVFKVNGKL
ncbi:hypothetical protein FE63_15645, partial [Staphylococcus aureus]